MKLCPKCKKLAYLNQYFGIYECPKCGWEEPISNNKVNEAANFISTLSVDEKKELEEKANLKLVFLN